MDQAPPSFRFIRLFAVIATMAIAFVAFRQIAPFAPLPQDVTKLVLWFAIPLAVLLVERRGNIGAALRSVGLKGFAWRAALPGLASLCAAGGTLIALDARMPANLDFAALGLTAIIAPFAEELLFRGYLVNGLVASGLGSVRAVVVGGLLFGLAHMGNVLDAAPATIILEVGITAAGGMLFGWTLLRFEGALVAAFAFHAGLNLAWDALAVDSTAIGDSSGNIARAAGIAAGVAAVLLLTRRAKRS